MASSLCRRQFAASIPRFNPARTLSTAVPTEQHVGSPNSLTSLEESSETPNTHFKITLRRSGISLGKKVQGTLLALGFHRRHQTVYFPHSPEVAGKILRVKELVEVENVPAHKVMTKQQQRQARRPPNGYEIVRSRKNSFLTFYSQKRHLLRPVQYHSD